MESDRLDHTVPAGSCKPPETEYYVIKWMSKVGFGGGQVRPSSMPCPTVNRAELLAMVMNVCTRCRI
jgi:hypothetical protein